MVQGRKRNIFQRGSHFSWFFTRREMLLFSGRNSHFGRPKTNLSGFETWKGTGKKSEVLSSFCNFSSFHFPFSTFPFSIFLLFYSIFPCLSLPSRSAEISWSDVSWGHSAPCPLCEGVWRVTFSQQKFVNERQAIGKNDFNLRYRGFQKTRFSVVTLLISRLSGPATKLPVIEFSMSDYRNFASGQVNYIQ